MKLMPLKFGGTCRVCRTRLEADTTAYYDRTGTKGHRITCVTCHGKPQAPQQQAPQLPIPAYNGEGVHHIDTSREYHRRHFDSLEAFTQWTEHGPALAIPANLSRSSNVLSGREGDSESSERWYGLRGGVPAVRAAVRDGWADGVQRMRDALREIGDTPAPRSLRRSLARGDYGDELDIHAVYRGAFDRAWTRRTKRERIGRANVRLIAHILDNSSANAKDTFWRGAAVLRLADALSEAGYNVEIWAGYCTHRYAKSSAREFEAWACLDTITVKPASAPLDINALAASLCLTGFARVWGFLGIIRAAEEIGCEHNYGLGSCYPLTHERWGLRGDDLNGTHVCTGVNSAGTARKWIADTINALEAPERAAA
jgi:hypothetical protein